MAQNDFLPIAIAPGAPVLSQPSWIAAVPANGRGAGILPKEYYNKAARQASVMAAAIGQIVADAGGNALDNGDIPTLAAAILAAFAGVATSREVYTLSSSNGAALSQSVVLSEGTWETSIETAARILTASDHDDDITVSQTSSLGGTTANTSFLLTKHASDTQTTMGVQIASNTRVVGPGGETVTMSCGAVSFVSSNGTAVSMGSRMIVCKRST